MTKHGLKTAAGVLALAVLPLAWDMAVTFLRLVQHWRGTELSGYLIDKSGFALAILMVLIGLDDKTAAPKAGNLFLQRRTPRRPLTILSEREGSAWFCWLPAFWVAMASSDLPEPAGLIARAVGIGLSLLLALADSARRKSMFLWAWPLWADTAFALSQGIDAAPAVTAGWCAVGLAVAIGEEGLYRGLILRQLAGLSPRRQVAVSAILFGAAHLIGLLSPVDGRMICAEAVSAVAIGIVLGAIRLRAGSIWPGIAAHAVLDAAGLSVTGGVSAAFAYSETQVVVMLATAVVTAGWGLWLCRSLLPVHDEFRQPV